MPEFQKGTRVRIRAGLLSGEVSTVICRTPVMGGPLNGYMILVPRFSTISLIHYEVGELTADTTYTLEELLSS